MVSLWSHYSEKDKVTRKIGILYICTGKYKLFWKGFFSTAEKFFLPYDEYQKSYFVFTDAQHISYEKCRNVNKIYQKQLPWPYITLNRFEIFQKALPQIKEMDYLYFFNANMLFVQEVGENILPEVERPLVFTLHPGFINKVRSKYTYEKNPKSLAYIPENAGTHYYMGGLIGGATDYYLCMVRDLSKRITDDQQNGVIAVWHDESHLNKYAVDYPQLIKKLSPEEYAWPQGWETLESPKILILDKNKYGGHDYLRNNQNYFQNKFQKLKAKLINAYQGIFSKR
ncbi:MAG: glycosyl transferase family 6 [Bacteroidales bacterium]|nr:glycosyl transferase family 6 [Bacteroidales bacterium]